MSISRVDPGSLFQEDAWLAEILGRRVFRLAAEIGAEMRHAQIEAAMRALGGGRDAFFFGKVPTRAVQACATLVGAGFYVVDTALTLAWKAGGMVAPPDVGVGLVRPEQSGAVLDIAERAFRWSRFHLDPQISAASANRVKREWMANYLRGARGSAVYMAEVGGAPAGFLAVLESGNEDRKLAAIDLLAVAPEFQGRGAGAALVRRFVHDFAGRATELRVGTQAANIRSLRLYENCGFRMVDSAFVLHAHCYEGELRR